MKRCLPIFLLLLCASAHGALNKWVDDEGKVHYSDQPPPANVKAQTLVPPPAIKGESAEKTIAEREAERKKAQKAKEEEAQQQENALAKQKNCEGAKGNLRVLKSNSPISTYNEKGESINMDDATRQKKIEEALKQISTYCD